MSISTEKPCSGVMFDDPVGVWPDTDPPQSRLVGVNSVFVAIHATDLYMSIVHWWFNHATDFSAAISVKKKLEIMKFVI